MPAPCVQVGMLHEPQDRLLLNAAAREDLMHYDPFFPVFNSTSPLAPSPLLPSPLRSARAREDAAAADAADTTTSHASATLAGAVGSAEGMEETTEAAAAALQVEEPRQLFCIDETGHLVVLDWKGNFFEQLRSYSVSGSSGGSLSGNSSGDSTTKITPVHMYSVPAYRVRQTKHLCKNSSGVSSRREQDACCRNSSSDNSRNGQTSGTGGRDIHSISFQSSSQTAGSSTRDPWYCWSSHTSGEEDDVATHIRAAWHVSASVSCATPVNPLLPDRIAFGGKSNDVKVFDFSQGNYIWTAKNVKSTLLKLQVPVHVSSLCWVPQVHPLVLAAGTAAGALRLYDLRCQRRPVFEQQYACSSSSLGGAAAREPRHLTALCTEAPSEKASALVAMFRKHLGTNYSNNSSRSNLATEINSDDGKDFSSSCCGNDASPLTSNTLNKERKKRSSSHSRGDIVLGQGGDRDWSEAGTLVAAETAHVSEDQGDQRREVIEAIRSLYGKERTRLFFSDNYGAVYVHRVLTGKSLLRRIDPHQKKYNKTSCYAESSSSEADTEGENGDEESQHGEDTDAEDDTDKGERTDEEEEDGSEEEEEDGSTGEDEENESMEEEEEEESGSEEGEEDGGKEDEEQGERDETRDEMPSKERIKRRQQQHQTGNTVTVKRKDKKRRRDNGEAVGGEDAAAQVSTADTSTGGKVTKSETATESEGKWSEGDTAAAREPEYNKRRAVQLLRRHQQKRMQKLSTIKNSGKLSQSAIHGAQYMTLFEGCYKGAMGAIVALAIDVSKGLLVGAGYGRHALVWKVRSRKLLFQVYLKQQLRTVLVRCGGSARVKRHVVDALKQQQNQNSQLRDEQPLQKHEGIQDVRQQKSQPQRDRQRMDMKREQSTQPRQSPLVDSMVQRRINPIHQEENAGTYILTTKLEQQKRRTSQSQVQRNQAGQRSQKEQKDRKSAEGIDGGNGYGRGRLRAGTEKGSVAAETGSKTGLFREEKKKEKRKTM